MNNAFVGTKERNVYGYRNVEPKSQEGKKDAIEFRSYLEKHPKGPHTTPEGDPYSINMRLRHASKYGIAFTRSKDRKIRFSLRPSR